MALPTVHRQLIVDNVKAALVPLKTIAAGVDYHHQLRTVTGTPSPLEQVDPAAMPWVLVTSEDGDSGNQPSQSDNDSLDLVLTVYVARNATRWPDLSAPELMEEVLADIEKVLDADLSRGGRATGATRTRELFHDLAGVWAVCILTESIDYTRRRP